MNMLTEQQTDTNQTTDRKYLVPFILITSLFFLWGFARAISYHALTVCARVVYS